MSLFLYIKLFQIVHKLFFPENMYYFHNIPHRSKRIFMKMLREFEVLILMFIRLEEFFRPGFEGSFFSSQISLATVCTFESLYSYTFPILSIDVFPLSVCKTFSIRF